MNNYDYVFEKIDNSQNAADGSYEQKSLYWDDTIKSFPKEKISILDIGSGVQLYFEKKLRKVRNADDIIDCIDFNTNDFDKASIDNFFCFDIQEKMEFDREYDVAILFEVLEHVDKTDCVIVNAYNALKMGGTFYIAVPNLTSIYARIEILLGFQPHCLEISNRKACFGMGKFGVMNYGNEMQPLHHIRGISYKGLKEMLESYGFEIVESKGYTNGPGKFFAKYFKSMASVIWFRCKKVS